MENETFKQDVPMEMDIKIIVRDHNTYTPLLFLDKVPFLPRKGEQFNFRKGIKSYKYKVKSISHNIVVGTNVQLQEITIMVKEIGSIDI